MSTQHRARFRMVTADCLAFLRGIEDESIDLVITDPAYESLEKHRSVGTTTRLKQSKGSSNVWFPIFTDDRFPHLMRELYRVLKMDAHFYLYCDQETAFKVKPLGESVGFRFWKPLVWDKVAIGMGYHYRARYEFILFFEKGKRKLNDLSVSDVLDCKRVHRGYPTEKPVPLNEVLVSQSTDPGETVLDVFAGSGSTGVAALQNGRRFIGCDIKPEAVTMARERLAGEGGDEDLDLPERVMRELPEL